MKSRNQLKKLEQINQAVKKYNQCLIYCEQQGEDLAIIQLQKSDRSTPDNFESVSASCTLYLILHSIQRRGRL